MGNRIEISCFNGQWAKVVNVADAGGNTATFLARLQKRKAFQPLLKCGREYHGLEWDRVPGFMAYCESQGVTATRAR